MHKSFLRIMAALLIPLTAGADPSWAFLAASSARPVERGLFSSQAVVEPLSVAFRTEKDDAVIVDQEISAPFSRSRDAQVWPAFLNVGTRLDPVLRSLGTAAKENPRMFPDDGRAAFHLSEDGHRFFDELFGSVSSEAFLLWTSAGEQRILKPFGIIVHDVSRTRWYLFEFWEVDHGADEGNRRRVLREAGFSLNSISGGAARDFADSFHAQWTQTRGGFRLLTLLRGPDSENVFHFGWDSFHKKLPQKVSLTGDIREIGVGRGDNAIVALRAGAHSFEGTDVSTAFVLLTRWNIALGVESGQLPADALGRARITWESGAGSMSPGDTYVANFGSIRREGDLPRSVAQAHVLSVGFVYIPTSQFRPILENLRDRLDEREGVVYARILPVGDNGLAQITKEQTAAVQLLTGEQARDLQRQFVALNYLEALGFSAHPLDDLASGDAFDGLFLLRRDPLRYLKLLDRLHFLSDRLRSKLEDEYRVMPLLLQLDFAKTFAKMKGTLAGQRVDPMQILGNAHDLLRLVDEASKLGTWPFGLFRREVERLIGLQEKILTLRGGWTLAANSLYFPAWGRELLDFVETRNEYYSVLKAPTDLDDEYVRNDLRNSLLDKPEARPASKEWVFVSGVLQNPAVLGYLHKRGEVTVIGEDPSVIETALALVASSAVPLRIRIFIKDRAPSALDVWEKRGRISVTRMPDWSFEETTLHRVISRETDGRPATTFFDEQNRELARISGPLIISLDAAGGGHYSSRHFGKGPSGINRLDRSG